MGLLQYIGTMPQGTAVTIQNLVEVSNYTEEQINDILDQYITRQQYDIIDNLVFNYSDYEKPLQIMFI